MFGRTVHHRIPHRKPRDKFAIFPAPYFNGAMVVIRRMDDGKRSYTAIFLPGEAPRIFPTSHQEHARILQIYKQDRPHPDVLNDFTDYKIGDENGATTDRHL